MGFFLGYAAGQQERDEGTFGDFVVACFQVLWYLLVIVVLVVTWPLRAYIRHRRKPAPRHKYEPEGLEFFEADPNKKDVWRYGY